MSVSGADALTCPKTRKSREEKHNRLSETQEAHAKGGIRNKNKKGSNLSLPSTIVYII